MLNYATTMHRPARIAVDCDAIAANTSAVQRIVGASVAVIGVVKANAYGHGAVRSAQAMLAGGATRLAVSTTAEGQQLRAAGIHAPILVLGHTPPECVVEALRDDLALMVGDAATLHAAAQVGRAAGRPLALHLKVDTGMHRLGLLPREVNPFLDAARAIDGVRWEGIFTHFATADEPWLPQFEQQQHCFEQVLASVHAAGWHFPLVHAANSAAALWQPAMRFNAIRAGIALYGVSPSEELSLSDEFRPALSFHSSVTRVADLPPGSAISYGARYVTSKQQRIATIAAGYADGVRRSPAWRAVLVRGQRAPVVGRVCMDYTMVDVTDIPNVQVGDDVVLLGAQGDARIRAREVAQWLDTSAYEVLTTVGG